MNVSQISETALLNCITILHTNKQTLGGNISFIEGDVFEVLYGNDHKIGLGQELGVTIYSPEGLIVFDTHPIAIYDKRVLCFLPPNFQKKIINRRKEVRVPVQKTNCFITGLQGARADIPFVELQTPIQCKVENISANGIRFLLETPLLLKTQDRVVIEIAGISLEGKIRFIQKVEGSISEHLGIEFVFGKDEKRNTIRSYLVQHQVANRPEQILNQKIEDGGDRHEPLLDRN